MYKKAAGLLVLGNLIFMLGFLCLRGEEGLRIQSQPVKQMKLELEEIEEKAKEVLQVTKSSAMMSGNLFAAQGLGIMEVTVSGQRVVDYDLVEQEKVAYELSDEEREALLRIVEAEAGSEDEDGRLLVANVVLNRMNNESFPDTVTEVVFQQSQGVTQFSPVASGRYYTVEISEKTIAAVERALAGEDISQGALFFASRKRASSSKMRWFDTKLTFLFEHGGHEFFK
ncbi:MAG: cell wall hydrolase [Acetatifactor sp.]|nr:cell wall hydrolase [Acetatifactor sp.]